MKKFLSTLILLTLILIACTSCAIYEDSNKETMVEIPNDSIRYTNFTFGNVIQDDKQAVFFNFISEYTVSKLEITGTLLDKNGNAIDSFDTSMSFGTPSQTPEMPIRIDQNLIKNVKSVSFTKITAYTTEKIN